MLIVTKFAYFLTRTENFFGLYMQLLQQLINNINQREYGSNLLILGGSSEVQLWNSFKVEAL